MKLVKNNKTIQNLKAAFDERKTFFANRSSCVFPVMLRPGTDLHIVYFNYWTQKNGISRDKLAINFRIYEKNGNPVLKISREMGEAHNQVSTRNLLAEHTYCDTNNFEGMLEVEITSLENFRFPFPGIVGIYQAGELFSAVHAAGRVKNPDEPQPVIYTQETNWTCKSGPNVTAFFHYFNGPTVPQTESILVKLRNRNGGVIANQNISIAHLPPFGSQIFYIADIFSGISIEADAFVSVTLEHNSIFPRMVVGNYFRDSNFLEVTHSFPLIEKEDFCPIQPEDEFQSILPAYTTPELALSVHIFPTNNPGIFSALEASQNFGANSLKSGAEFMKCSGEPSAPLTYELDPAQQFWCLRMKGPKVPSRFNASYRYKVRGTAGNYSTDIADGADSCVYPPKYRHWGFGYLGHGFETVVLVRNNTHRPTLTRPGIGTLRVFCKDGERSIPVKIGAETAISINLTEYISHLESVVGDAPCFLSWMLEMDIPTCETFWISYRKKDGAIMGEHGI